MARRASSGVNIQALAIGIGILALVLGGGYFVLNPNSSDFDAPELDVEIAIANSRSLAGNKYKTTGTLYKRHIEPEGQVIILQTGEQTNPKFLPIIIPADFKAGNLSLQSKYTFLIEFDTKGVAVAIDVKQL